MNFINEKDNYGGQFVKFSLDKKVYEIILEAEPFVNAEGFVSSSRLSSPFWMKTTVGKTVNDIPRETQFFAVKYNDGTYGAFFSLACENFRTSFYGENGKLYVAALTGDTNCLYDTIYGYYKITGNDFYDIVAKGAKSICEKFGTTELRNNKPAPEFMKYFGWCTWDSFYHDVSKDNIIKGLESFKKGGFVPKFLLIDDGWQSITDLKSDEDFAHVECSLTDFKVCEKFGASLKDTVDMVKGNFGVEEIFVWHAIVGYWSGVSVDSPLMQKYQPKIMHSVNPDTLRHNTEHFYQSEQRDFGMINPDMAEEFYNDYHTYLKGEGIDGVKVDTQATADSISEGLGGRTTVVSKLRNGLESSVNKNFDGGLINCMSCSNDVIYHLKNSNMIRTSDDFMPLKPETHIKHIYDNAFNSIWVGEFSYCDWDMFQTTHEYGKFHAAARAISGSPIYVSDKVDEHNFDLIKTLIDDEGMILKPEEIARPTVDCLFKDVIAEKTPFKIYNVNKFNGVVGVFSGEDDETKDAKTINVKASDVCGYNSGKYAVYCYNSGKTYVLDANETIEISVKAKEFEIITFAPIKDGSAYIGITEKLNSGGAITDIKEDAVVNCKGTLLSYSEEKGFYTTEIK